DLARGLRPAEVVALPFDTTQRSQLLRLLLGLDAFGGRLHPQAGAEADDRLHDRQAVLTLRKVADERLVDLDLVEREAAEIAERGVSGAEIVHGDMHAERAQLMQDRERRLVVLKQHGFRDLELEP